MYNDPALDGLYLGKITTDFVQVADRLQEASYLMRRRGYVYPIFPAAPAAIRLGALLVDRGELDNQWHYYVTYLDALVKCKLVAENKVTAFKSTYKDPDEFSCLLVVDREFAKFVYIPYPVD
ncbi:MAG: hypothetical protein AAF400_02990 [Bacteroidota bacterium]